MQLPALRRELEAEQIEFADAMIAKFKADFGFGKSMLDPGFGADFMVNAFKSAAREHPFQMGLIKEFERQGCEYSREALRQLAAEALEQERKGNGKVPDQVADYIFDHLNPNLQRSPSARPGNRPADIDLRFQNYVIVFTIHALIERFPRLRPTGRSKRQRSACSIVADRVTAARIGRPISEKRVEGVWNYWQAREKIIEQQQRLTVLTNPPT
jgi:hypothetical protein